MKFIKTGLAGSFIVEIEKLQDHRGFFARTWCRTEFMQHGLGVDIMQTSISFNKHKGTLRGMHYLVEPYSECKLVRCTQGAIYDVIIDLRSDSPTYKSWFSIELTAANYRMLHIPKMFAHGFQTLADETVVSYQSGQIYVPDAERGIRYNDRAFNIRWPLEVSLISDKDQTWKDFADQVG